MSSGEFEDRENETLGELPQPIQTERREFSQTDADKVPISTASNIVIGQQGANAPIPPDIQKQGDALRQGKDGKLGSPVIPASVTSIYDARPINARDWMVTKKESVFGGLFALTSNQVASIQYTVPPGFTGVLKRFAFEPATFAAFTDNDRINGAEWDGVSVSLKVQGINVPDYQNLQLGQSADILMDTFVLASEGQIIELILTYSDQIINYLGETSILMRMYGNNLLTRGLPTPFEIATQIKSGTDATS